MAKVASNGAFQGDNPLDFALPLIILQICLVLVVTRGLAYLLRPLRQPRVIAEIIVSAAAEVTLDRLLVLLRSMDGRPATTSLPPSAPCGRPCGRGRRHCHRTPRPFLLVTTAAMRVVVRGDPQLLASYQELTACAAAAISWFLLLAHTCVLVADRHACRRSKHTHTFL